MSSRWVEVGRLARENGARDCRVLNGEGLKDPRCTGAFEENHHGIFAAQKNGKTTTEWRHFLDHPYNHCPACRSCNVNRVGDGSEARYHYFLRQLKRYGKTQVRVWLNSAPDDIKARHEWKRYFSLCEKG